MATRRPEDGLVLAAHDWSSHHAHPRWAPGFPLAAETSFVLPLPSHELYLLSRGAALTGNLRLKQHGQLLTVSVRLAYHHPPALARASVCLLRRGAGRSGVGIYTPAESHDHRDRLQCDVLLTLPATDVPLHIPTLSLLTTNFAHEIADMWRTLRIDTLDLATSNAPVRIAGITVHTATVTSSNGPISGHFNARALTLATSNAGIHASVSLFSAGNTATLNMHTSNGPVASAIALVPDGPASFAVHARSTNGPVDLRYEDVPAQLVSEVRTSNAPANVVAPAFDGAFDVSTSNARAAVRDVRPLDPTGAGRPRIVDQNPGRNAVSGRAWWGAPGGGGRCVVHTSNAGASLDL